MKTRSPRSWVAPSHPGRCSARALSHYRHTLPIYFKKISRKTVPPLLFLNVMAESDCHLGGIHGYDEVGGGGEGGSTRKEGQDYGVQKYGGRGCTEGVEGSTLYDIHVHYTSG